VPANSERKKIAFGDTSSAWPRTCARPAGLKNIAEGSSARAVNAPAIREPRAPCS
jgi:hypothetical protein